MTRVSTEDVQKMSNKELNGNLPPMSKKIRVGRLRLVGHLLRQGDEMGLVALWSSDGSVN